LDQYWGMLLAVRHLIKNEVRFLRKVFGAPDSSRLFPMIGILWWDQRDLMTCGISAVSLMGALRATNHDYEISRSNSCQSRMRWDQRCYDQTRQFGCCNGHTCLGTV
jgi:hypothetical protein